MKLIEFQSQQDILDREVEYTITEPPLPPSNGASATVSSRMERPRAQVTTRQAPSPSAGASYGGGY
jgi:hypothetical protein